MSLQAAIDHTVQLLHDGYTEFKMYEKELIDDVEAEIKMLGGEHGGSLCTKETMQGYIDSLKNVIMANGHWR